MAKSNPDSFHYEDGSMQIYDIDSFQQIVAEFAQTRKLDGFQELESHRKRLIKEYIGWADGFNSLRAAIVIAKVVREVNKIDYQPAPAKVRFRNTLRHIARVIVTRNGRIGYWGDGLLRGLIRALIVPAGSNNGFNTGFLFHLGICDRFLRGVMQNAASRNYPKIEKFIANHQESFDQVLNEFLDQKRKILPDT